jgi:hypothetical protein
LRKPKLRLVRAFAAQAGWNGEIATTFQKREARHLPRLLVEVHFTPLGGFRFPIDDAFGDLS